MTMGKWRMGKEGKLKHVPRPYIIGLAAALIVQIAFWSQAHVIRIPWAGVSIAPSPAIAAVLGLGDRQLYYRAATFGLQGMGDWAGEMTPLVQYDYARLAGWFTLLSKMDPASHYAPSLAAYYFGASRDPGQVRQIIPYLRQLAGSNPEKHWRWMAYSVYLARYRVKDPILALEISQQLAVLPVADMPIWTRQLPAFVLADAGEREAARDILEAILATTPDLHPSERYFMRDYIDSRLGFSPKIP